MHPSNNLTTATIAPRRARRGGERLGPAATTAVVALLLLCVERGAAQTDSELEALRHKMVAEAVVGAGVRHPGVIDVIRRTPRHRFISSQYRHLAYFDMAVPIGESQTISSPFIVAYMTESIDPQPSDRVLEIGTGSGYQAAVLSPLVNEVYTIEIVAELGQRAQRVLTQLGYTNVFTRVGDGYLGWPEQAPFNKIIVTCSPEKPPQPLIDQLADGGLMIVPVGERYQQSLYLLRKRQGRLEQESLRPTLFVPMTGQAESQRQVQPDPLHPTIVNGDFEQPLPENGFVPGWYYGRQLECTHDPDGAPSGSHYLVFRNQQPGHSSHLLQGVPLDGRHIREVELSGRVRFQAIAYDRFAEGVPSFGVTFYDESRRDLGHHWIGPFRGDSPWKEVSERFRVPPQTREIIVRIGLFGATGELAFDQARLAPVAP